MHNVVIASLASCNQERKKSGPFFRLRKSHGEKAVHGRDCASVTDELSIERYRWLPPTTKPDLVRILVREIQRGRSRHIVITLSIFHRRGSIVRRRGGSSRDAHFEGSIGIYNQYCMHWSRSHKHHDYRVFSPTFLKRDVNASSYKSARGISARKTRRSTPNHCDTKLPSSSNHEPALSKRAIFFGQDWTDSAINQRPGVNLG